MSGHCITSLDVRDPSHPVEAGHLLLDSEAIPHWLAIEQLDDRHIDLNRKWPDGYDGPAIPHATLFY